MEPMTASAYEKSCTAAFEEACITLENEIDFYKRYISTYSSADRYTVIHDWLVKYAAFRMADGHFKWKLVDYFDDRYHGDLYTNKCKFRPKQEQAMQEEAIDVALRLLKGNYNFSSKFVKLMEDHNTLFADFRELIRKAVKQESQSLHDQLKFRGDHRDAAEAMRLKLFEYFTVSPPVPTPTEEIPMTSTVDFFQEKKFLNGKDVSTMSNAEIYAAIAAKENEITRLEAMKTQLKRSQREIEGHKADLARLVEYLDSEPTP